MSGTINLVRYFNQPGFLAICATQVTANPFMVSQVESIGITAINVGALMSLVSVPSDKISDIIKIIAVGGFSATIISVIFPSSFEGLAISVGAGGSFPRDHPQELGACRFGCGIKVRLLMNDGHLYAYRDVPACLRILCGPVPGRVLLKNSTNIAGLFGRGWGTGRHQARGEGDAQQQSYPIEGGVVVVRHVPVRGQQ